MVLLGIVYNDGRNIQILHRNKSSKFHLLEEHFNSSILLALSKLKETLR